MKLRQVDNFEAWVSIGQPRLAFKKHACISVKQVTKINFNLPEGHYMHWSEWEVPDKTDQRNVETKLVDLKKKHH